MTIELIIAAVMAALPTISAIAGIFVAACKIFSNNKSAIDKITADFQEVKEEVVKTKEYENLKIQYEATQAQYIQLLKAHRELLTQIDKIARKEEDYEGKQTN